MASSYLNYTGDGAQTNWAVSFPYLDADHVHFYVNGVEVTSGISWPNVGTISVTPAVAAGAAILIQRISPDAALVTFSNRQAVNESNLSTSTLQAIYRAVEASDRAALSVVPDSTGNFNVQNKKVINLADPTADTDAANKHYVDTSASSAVEQADAARDAAQATLAQMNGVYLGAQAADPTLDNNGNALTAGVWYFNTTSNAARIYSGTVWSDAVGNVQSFNNRSGIVVATAGDYDASQITNTPAGNIASVTVQDAINELDSEKADGASTTAALATKLNSSAATATGLALLSATDEVAARSAINALIDTAMDAVKVDSLLNARASGNIVVPEQTSVFVMKDGSVCVSGNGSYLGLSVQATAAYVGLPVTMPVGLQGKPVYACNVGTSFYVLTDAGDVAVWGSNGEGELGVGDLATRHVPVLLHGTSITPRSGITGRDVVEIVTSAPSAQNQAAGSVYFRCSDNTLWACGYNANGELAVGDLVLRNVPTQCLKESSTPVADCVKVRASGGSVVSVGYIDTAGKVRLAGWLNGTTPAGGWTGTAINQTSFHLIWTTADSASSQLPSNYVATDVFVGGGQVENVTPLVLCADKCAYAWGTNTNGGVGNGTLADVTLPVKVGSGTAVAASLNGTIERIFDISSAGYANWIAQTTDGKLWVWGGNNANDLGAGTSVISVPQQPSAPLNVAMPVLENMHGGSCYSAAWYSQNLARFADGSVYSWGTIAASADGETAAAATNVPIKVNMPRTSASLKDAAGFGWATTNWWYLLFDDGTVYGSTPNSNATSAVPWGYPGAHYAYGWAKCKIGIFP